MRNENTQRQGASVVHCDIVTTGQGMHPFSDSEINGYLVSTVNEVVSSSSTPSYTNRKLEVAHSPIHSS